VHWTPPGSHTCAPRGACRLSQLRRAGRGDPGAWHHQARHPGLDPAAGSPGPRRIPEATGLTAAPCNMPHGSAGLSVPRPGEHGEGRPLSHQRFCQASTSGVTWSSGRQRLPLPGRDSEARREQQDLRQRRTLFPGPLPRPASLGSAAAGRPPRGNPPAAAAAGALAASRCVEVDRLVNGIGGITLLNRLILVGSPLAGSGTASASTATSCT
jgi:hypothetical protein